MFHDIYQGKKVIITGHTGFKGSWLAVWLIKLGANVVGISLKPITQPNHFDLLNLDCKTHFLDIRNSEKLNSIIKQEKADIIFHLAAQAIVRDSYIDPLGTYETNTLGTANLLNACRNVDNLKAIVAVTTDKCYENKETNQPYKETDAMGGYDPYSASKGCAELIISSFRRAFFNLEKLGKEHNTLIASARGGNVIGGGDWAKDRLIPDIVRTTTQNEAVLIRNPNATRPWQHVLECLSGYLNLGLKLFEGNKDGASAWNFGPSAKDEATVLDVVKNMQQVWPDIKYEIDSNNHHPYEANLLKLDSTKARTNLKWGNVFNLKKALSMTTEWYREYYNNRRIITFEQLKEYENLAQQQNINWAISK